MVSALANGGEISYHSANIANTDHFNNSWNNSSSSGSPYLPGAHGYDARSLSHSTTQMM